MTITESSPKTDPREPSPAKTSPELAPRGVFQMECCVNGQSRASRPAGADAAGRGTATPTEPSTGDRATDWLGRPNAVTTTMLVAANHSVRGRGRCRAITESTIGTRGADR
jgi:hypothetical protein